MSTIIDPAFEGVGKVAGLTLWRVENKLVVKQPAVSGYGSHTLLASRQSGSGVCVTQKEHHIDHSGICWGFDMLFSYIYEYCCTYIYSL